MSPKFIHLHIHSEYSLVDGVVRINDLISMCAKLGMPAVALTDQMNVFALVKFYKAAIAAGIKPIMGSQICLSDKKDPKKRYKAVLLCQNREGYLNLSDIISKAFLQGQQGGEPLVDIDWLKGKTDGLICLSGAQFGDIGQALVANKLKLAEQRAEQWMRLFPNRFYIELQRIGRRDELPYINSVLPLAKKLKLPLVATNGVRFIQPDDFEAHEARVAIHDGYTLADPKRPRNHTRQQFLRSPDDMQQLFSDLPSALQNTVEIAKRCNFMLELGNVYLPDFPVPQGMTTESYFRQQSEDLLQQYLDKLKPENSEIYHERLKIELDVIISMGFPGYFLIVADFIQWAKDNDIPVGPGRGSGAGSLVAFVLKITNLDPIKHELLFERFLNPERVSMPDFDIDFCMEGRDRVIDYVAQKYGRDAVSQIITYGTMAAKAVVRDVGRVLGHPYGFVDQIAKLIPFELGITLDKALAQEEQLRQRYEKEEEVNALITLAKKLEGVTRNVGKHAGGVVIAPSKISDFSPIYCEPGETSIVSQFDKDDVEAIGLVKFDFLGLRTLTIIDWAVKNVKASRSIDIDIDNIPTDDKATFDLLKACNTTAVFQLESRGMKDLVKRLQPDSFEDITALVALFRPGPLQSGMVDDFINRKHGREKIIYPHPDLETILKPTYGVILYQEQVMQIAQVLANYTLGGADLLRRAMGKKKPEEMAKQRLIFVEGATKRGVEKKTATYIFDLMEKFAGYGFNKSHSAAYALLAYQTAYLKAHYPAEFMAAVMSSDMDNTDKVVGFYEDCKQIGLTVSAPDINYGEYKFSVASESEIRYGLGAIKGAGESAISGIIAERNANGKFTDLFDFAQRIDLRKANKRVLEALIKSGALDSFGAHRAALLATLPNAIHNAEQHSRNQDLGQTDLFGDLVEEQQLPYVAAPEWTKSQLLENEKQSLGLYLSGHPLQRYQYEFKQLTTSSIAELRPAGKQTVKIAGIVKNIRVMNTKRGDRMAFVGIDDGTAHIEVAVFPEAFEQNRRLLVKDNILILIGEVSVDNYSGNNRMSAQDIMSIDTAREIYSRGLVLRLKAQQTNKDFVAQLQRIINQYQKGRCKVYIDYKKDDSVARIELGDNWQIQPSNALLDELSQILDEESVILEY